MLLKKHLINITWKKPSLKEEIEEFERTAEDLRIDKNKLIEAFKKGKLITLQDDVWEKIQNTDSWETTTLKDAQRLAKEYGKNLHSLIEAKELPAAIVLKNKNDYYLIAGNTRLMYSRANKINPKIFLITL